MASKKHNRAISVLEQKLRDNPHSRAFSRLAELYREDGDLVTAIEVCTSGLARHPGYVTARLVLGRCYMDQNNLAAATDEMMAVCAGDERNHAALKMLADIFAAQGRGEAAGSLYAILSDMEPDNAAIRQAAAKNRSRMRGGIRDILGLRAAANAERLAQNIEAAGVSPFDNMQSLETIQGAPTITMHLPPDPAPRPAAPAPTRPPDPVQAAAGQEMVTGKDIESQLDSIFGEHTASVPAMPAISIPQPAPVQMEPAGHGMVTGSDVADQLDSLFGEQTVSIPAMPVAPTLSLQPEPPQIAPVQAQERGMVTGDDVADQLDSLFGEQTVSIPAIPAAPTISLQPSPPQPAPMPVSADVDMLTGSDIEGQLDAIFGGQTISAPAMSAAPPSMPPDVINLVTGNDVGDQLDALFGGSAIAAPSMSAPPPPPDIMNLVTGSAGDDQLDALFGGMAIAAPVMDAPPPPSDIISLMTGGGADGDQLDALFGGQAIAAPVSIPEREVSLKSAGDGDPVMAGGYAESQFDAIFGGQDITMPASAIDQELTLTSAGDGGPAMTGSDVESQLDAIFGGQTLSMPSEEPPAMAMGEPLSAPALVAEDATCVIEDRLALLYGGDADEAKADLVVDGYEYEAALPEAATAGPVNLFDFGAEETIQFGRDDLASIMDSGAGVRGAAPESHYTAGADAAPSSPEIELAGSITAIAAGEPAAELLARTDAVSGDDIEARLSELFSAETGAAPEAHESDTLEDIARAAAQPEPEPEDLDIIDADSLESSDFLSPEDFLDGLSGGGKAAGAVGIVDNAGIAGDFDGFDDIGDVDDISHISAASAVDDLSDAGIVDTVDIINDADIANTVDAVNIAGIANIADTVDADDIMDSGDIVGNIDDIISIGAINNIDIADTAGAGAAGDTSDELPPAVDDVQDKIRQLFRPEGAETESIDIGFPGIDSGFGGSGVDSTFDERDTPFDLPDHVLTSTLADIYYQQGQPHLALHIYERLALRSPEDDRLQARVAELRVVLLQADPGGRVFAGAAGEAGKSDGTSQRKKKGTAAKDDRRPLAGVKIKKGAGAPAKKSARGKKP